MNKGEVQLAEVLCMRGSTSSRQFVNKGEVQSAEVLCMRGSTSSRGFCK